jgi:serine kinase of HPr protein (carbohydrate metabolism regulator)
MSETIANVSCVAIRGRGLLIEGPPGSGKSSLALALIDRGAVLVGDDAVTLAATGDRLTVSPPPNTAGMLDIRNVGIVEMATTSAPLALVVRLDTQAPRYIEAAERAEHAGQALPLIALHPDSPVLALRAEHALTRYGLG